VQTNKALRVGLGPIMDVLGLIFFLYFWVSVRWISKLLDLDMSGRGLNFLPLGISSEQCSI
jgi:hypothetical protein